MSRRSAVEGWGSAGNGVSGKVSSHNPRRSVWIRSFKQCFFFFFFRVCLSVCVSVSSCKQATRGQEALGVWCVGVKGNGVSHEVSCVPQQGVIELQVRAVVLGRDSYVTRTSHKSAGSVSYLNRDVSSLDLLAARGDLPHTGFNLISCSLLLLIYTFF